MNIEHFNIIEKVKILIIENENAIGKMIDYEEIKRLNKKYFPNLNERDFALEVLELTYSSYRHMKNEKKRGRILLRTGKTQISQIQQLLIKIGYDERHKINYKELKKLKEIFGENLDEEFFATKCLRLPLHNGYYALKENANYRRHINLPNIKNKIEIDINHTIKEINDLQIIGKKITYSKLQELYMEYGMGMTETEFAQFVLGISLSMYSKIKNDSTKSAKVRNRKLEAATEYIKTKFLNDHRYYTESEIETICLQNGISVEEFIRYCILNDSVFYLKSKEYVDQYMTRLKSKKQIYIGKTRLSNKFIERNIDFLNSCIDRVERKYRYIRDYFNIDKDDYRQKVLLYAIENLGDLEKNFDDNSEFLKQSMYSQINSRYFAIKVRELEINYHKSEMFYKYKGEIKLEDKGEDISQKVEAEQIGDVLDNDLCFQIVNELKQEHNEGIQKTIAMKNVMKKYNINQVELLEYMNLYIQIQEEKVAETELEI